MYLYSIFPMVKYRNAKDKTTLKSYRTKGLSFLISYSKFKKLIPIYLLKYLINNDIVYNIY